MLSYSCYRMHVIVNGNANISQERPCLLYAIPPRYLLTLPLTITGQGISCCLVARFLQKSVPLREELGNAGVEPQSHDQRRGCNLCGVSTQTVSRVLNNRPGCRPRTRENESMTPLPLWDTDRVPWLERSWPGGATRSVCCSPGWDTPAPSSPWRGIVDEAANLGLTVLIAELPEGDSLDDPRPAISALVERHVDGIIMSVPAVGHAVDRIKAVLPEHREPVVFVKAGVSDRYSSVLVDNAAAIEEVVDHLVSIGRTRIGHISGPINWHEAHDRREGWQRGIGQARTRSRRRALRRGRLVSRQVAPRP